MSKRDVSAEHLEKFREMLKSVERFLPLDWNNIGLLLKQRWPKSPQSAAMLAVSGQVRDACMPFLPLVSFTPPIHHLSKKHPVMEFILINQDASRMTLDRTDNQATIPVTLSIFQSGRQVLRVYGLRLDHIGSESAYGRGQLLVDTTEIWHPKMVLKLIRNLIDAFEIAPEDHLSSTLRVHALEDLRPQ